MLPEHPDAPVFSVREASFRYPDGAQALSNVSFEVKAGERVALVGANGSGKSTLLRLLCALDHPTAGRVQAYGKDLTQANMAQESFAHDFRRRVQFVFQDSDVQLFSSTVEEEVAFGPLQLWDDPADVRREVDAALEQFGISRQRARTPFRLSGGEKRKVALASVLVLRPAVLLMDEPTAGLDPRSVGALIDILDDFASNGGTTVIATHELQLLTELANRAIVIGEDHTIQRDAPVGDILADRPLLERCNLVHAHRHHHEGMTHVHPHEHPLPGTEEA